MNSLGTFPFGQPVVPLKQASRTPKRVFILGVYASAVHAKWVKADGKTAVRALAVRSEPEIFWRGDRASQLIESITIPAGCGHLEPSATRFNGPSGLALDTEFLEPLGLTRADAWLCDLVPYSCANKGQVDAVKREYEPLAREFGLPEYSVPCVPTRYTDAARRAEILAEMKESGAATLVLLGDKPIQWFLSAFEPKWQRLSDFGESRDDYGRLHQVNLGGQSLGILPLAHPRQAAALGKHSGSWRDLHAQWSRTKARNVLS